MVRYLEDRTVEETALLTGWSETMVKVQAWRARSKLKKLFQKAGVEIGS
jgi:RNA polymerase sigma-70 factor (ECF subfamily)